MLNETAILNMALMRVGARAINLGEQNTPAAQAARQVYPDCLNYCLSLYPWDFATRYTLLARGADTPAFGWKYSLPLPGDCVRVLGVRAYPDDLNALSSPETLKYEVVGREIYANESLLALRYISNKMEAGVPELFGDALAWRVAFELAALVAQGGANAQNYLQLFEQALDRAKVELDAQDHPLPKMGAGASGFLTQRMVVD